MPIKKEQTVKGLPGAIDMKIKSLAMTAAKAVMAAQQSWVCRCFKKWIVITAQ